MQRISFDAEVTSVDRVLLVRLPAPSSRDLPSRGQVAVTAEIDGHRLDTVVEPDGRRGHWIRLTPDLCERADLDEGATVDISLQVAQHWPEPEVPDDLSQALAGAPQKIRVIWADITPMARWEWVRWIGATKNPDTRRRRVEVAVDKIDHGKRRPCCFDLSSCTDPEVASSGKLREPS